MTIVELSYFGYYIKNWIWENFMNCNNNKKNNWYTWSHTKNTFIAIIWRWFFGENYLFGLHICPRLNMFRSCCCYCHRLSSSSQLCSARFLFNKYFRYAPFLLVPTVLRAKLFLLFSVCYMKSWFLYTHKNPLQELPSSKHFRNLHSSSQKWEEKRGRRVMATSVVPWVH